jgi:hypothetical protein
MCKRARTGEGKKDFWFELESAMKNDRIVKDKNGLGVHLLYYNFTYHHDLQSAVLDTFLHYHNHLGRPVLDADRPWRGRQ